MSSLVLEICFIFFFREEREVETYAEWKRTFHENKPFIQYNIICQRPSNKFDSLYRKQQSLINIVINSCSLSLLDCYSSILSQYVILWVLAVDTVFLTGWTTVILCKKKKNTWKTWIMFRLYPQVTPISWFFSDALWSLNLKLCVCLKGDKSEVHFKLSRSSLIRRNTSGFFERSQGYWIQSVKTLLPSQTHCAVFFSSLHLNLENSDTIDNNNLEYIYIYKHI